jgi:hypothetical protein
VPAIPVSLQSSVTLRDLGTAMPNRPDIDPNWMRRRRPPERDYTILGVALAVFMLVALAAYGLYTGMATPRVAPANVPAPALAADADLERRSRLAEQAQAMQSQRQEAARQAAADGGTGSSINGRPIHRCVYAGHESLQAAPCASPWVDAGQFERGSRWARVEDQEQMRRDAEAKLRVEERRFAAAAGLESGPQVYYPPASPVASAQARCALAKADRDRAYKLVGNDRSFDFIRRWDDIVFEACKGT